MQQLKYVVGLTLSKPFTFFLINIPDFEKYLQVSSLHGIYSKEDIYKK